MIFNGNSTGIVQDIEFWTGLGRTTISGDTTNLLPEFTGRINAHYHKVVSMILEAQDESDFDDGNHSDFPIITTDLVALQPDYSIPLSEKVIQIKRAEITYDGTNYERLNPIDINEISSPTNATTIGDEFETDKPFYDFQYGSLFLYPIPQSNVTGGLKLWVTREVLEYSGVAGPTAGEVDNADEPGFDENYHRMISLGASLDWILVNQPKNTNLIRSIKEELLAYEVRLKNHYGRKLTDRVMKIKSSQGVANYR